MYIYRFEIIKHICKYRMITGYHYVCGNHSTELLSFAPHAINCQIRICSDDNCPLTKSYSNNMSGFSKE